MIPQFMGLLLMAFAPSQEGDRLVATIPEGVGVGDVSFSNDGTVVAYRAMKGDQFWIVAGDWKSQPSKHPSIPFLLGSGKGVIYAAFSPETSTYIVHFNDTILFETGNLRDWAWRLPGAVSSDGKVVASDVRNPKTGKSGVALNGKIQELHAGTAFYPVLSQDGKVFAFALEKDDGHCIVVNDRPGPMFDWVTQPAISADGRIVAYGAEAGDNFFLIQGDRKLAVKASPKGVFMSSDGVSIGYWRSVRADNQKVHQRVIIGDKEGPEFQSILSPVFSPNSQHITYRAKENNGKWCVVIDDRKIEVGDILVDPVFMESGNKVGYGVRLGRELWWKHLEVK
jgi:hypothetical protein